MRATRLAALLAVAGAAVAIGAAPIAIADECDPTATVCQGPEVSAGGGSAVASAPAATDQFPYDNDWYYGAPSEEGLTATNPGFASPSTGGDHGGAGGGGGHGGR